MIRRLLSGQEPSWEVEKGGGSKVGKLLELGKSRKVLGKVLFDLALIVGCSL